MVSALPQSFTQKQAFEIAAGVCDPEIPVLTIADLGILRDVELERDGTVAVTITPTYSGCPAMQTIEADVIEALQSAGFSSARVNLVHAPAWTTDWMSAEGKRKLKEYGIAPPAKTPCGRSALFESDAVSCPRCDSKLTSLVSAFGSTACKAHYRCESCLEPFDHFKCI
ncbi:MAG: 1,2-phenylacetyl-CoA epoxidase subunit PaaD [Stappiaceae bacterium]